MLSIRDELPKEEQRFAAGGSKEAALSQQSEGSSSTQGKAAEPIRIDLR